jgi:excisionase family DNA binding protein
MARTRLNPRRAKLHLSYTVEEIARLYGLHRNTVRAWIRSGGLQPIDGGRPVLVKGAVLRAFLEARRRQAKRPCPPGTLYCLGCHAPRKPALDMADFRSRPKGAGNLSALCEACGTVMHRRASLAALPLILPGVEVRIMEAEPSLSEPASPSLNCHFNPAEAA